MIPILFSGDAATFDSNGKGLLSDCISCEVEQVRNGIFELNMKYPIDGIHYQDIQWEDIILAQAETAKPAQAFTVKEMRPAMDGTVEIFGEHISYVLNWAILKPYSAETVNEALLNFPSHLALNSDANTARYNNFDFWTDKTTSAHFEFDTLMPARAMLGGTEGSILDVYGGEYEFDNFHVKLWNSRGGNYGVVIRYGKNLTDMKADWSAADAYNRVAAFWKGKDADGNDAVVNGTDRWGWSTPNYYYTRYRIVDASRDFSEKPTLAEVNEYAHSYSTAHGNDRFTKDNITINFVALQDTEEYKNVANLEHVNLCDTVSVLNEEMGIEYQAKVIRTKYDTLRERYIEIEIGSDVRSTFGQTLKKDIASNSEAAIATVENNVSQLRAALEEATGKITGATDGYIKQIFNSTGDWSELVAMNTNDPATATKVWRMNYEGIGGGTSYDGPFTITMTLDGKINASQITTGVLNADLITAGTMSANRILGGTMKLGGANNTNGLLEIYAADGTTKIGTWGKDGLFANTGGKITSKDGSVYFDLDKNELTCNYLRGKTGSVPYWVDKNTYYGGRVTSQEIYIGDKSIVMRVGGTSTGINIYPTGARTGDNWIREISSKAGIRIANGVDNGASIDVKSDGEILFHGGPNSSNLTIAYIDSSGVHLPEKTYALRSGSERKVAVESSSSVRYKNSIKPINEASLDPHKLLSLPVVQFIWNDNAPLQYEDMRGQTIPGIIAEDVAEIYPSAVIHDAEGRVESWDERRLIPGMLALIQEQDKKIKELEARLARLEKLLT